MSESPSLYEAAMAELDADVTPEEYISMLGPDWIREKTVERLQSEGVELIGDPSAIERLLTRESEIIVADLYLWLGDLRIQTTSGRPKNGFVRDLLLTSAYYAFTQAGCGKTEARRAAAKRLGDSITKDKVEKAERTVRRKLGNLMRSFGKERMLQLTASLVLLAQNELEKIEAEIERRIRDEEAAHRKRRFYASGDACFRALSNNSVVGRQ